MPPSASELNDCLVRILQAAATLPPITLLPQERMTMAGSAFREAPLLVEAVCKAVEEQPALFAEVPMDPAETRAGQERAWALFCLSASLQRLARQAHDAYLFEQSQATTRAMDVVRYTRCQLQVPHLTRRHQRMEDALLVPEQILARRCRKRYTPRFTADDFVKHLRSSTPARPGAEEKAEKEKPMPIAERPPGPICQDGQEPEKGAARMPLPIPPTPPPAAPPVTARDMAPASEIQHVREELSQLPARYHLCRFTRQQRSQQGGTLSAAELAAAQAASRFLEQRGDVGAAAGVPRDAFERNLQANLALARLGRAVGQIEATATIGDMMLSARLTERSDRVLLFVDSAEVSQEEREALRNYLASADLIYDRQMQLMKDRKARAMLRRDRHAAELQDAKDETERLRRRERVLSGSMPER